MGLFVTGALEGGGVEYQLDYIVPGIGVRPPMLRGLVHVGVPPVVLGLSNPPIVLSSPRGRSWLASSCSSSRFVR